MRKNTIRMIGVGATGLLIGVVLSSGSSVANAAGTSLLKVFVSNDAAHPVPVTGSVGVNNLPATQAVSGTVHVAAPQHPWATVNDVDINATDNTQMIFDNGGSGALDMSSLTAATYGSNPGTVRVFVQGLFSTDASASCDTAGTSGTFVAGQRFNLTVPVGESFNVTYPTPLHWSADGYPRVCVQVSAFGPTDFHLAVSANGFTS